MSTCLTLVTLLAHMATLGCMLAHRPDSARGPLPVLGLAWMLMVAAGGSAIELVLGMKPASLPEMATALLVAVLVFRARGDLARLLCKY